MEEEIIQPIDKALLKSELTPDKQLRMTNKSHNEIYIVTANDSPNVLKEIGRLREIAFRTAGGGSGKSMDLDEFDYGDNCYKQLIVWNPEADEIIGGYRYLLGKDWKLDEKGQPILATSHMFHFSDKFLKEYMPYTRGAGSFLRVVGIPERAQEHQEYLRLGQLVGWLGRSDRALSRTEVFLRQNDDVSFLYPQRS